MKKFTQIILLSLLCLLFVGEAAAQSGRLYQGPQNKYSGYVDKSYYDGFPIPKNGHKIYFGWFRGYGENSNFWTGKRGFIHDREGGMALCDLPDSVDCVSLFAIGGTMTEDRKKDMAEFQARGAKVLFAISTQGEGNDGGFLPVMGHTKAPSGWKEWCQHIFECCSINHFNGFDWGFENRNVNNDHHRYCNEIISELRRLFDEFNATLGDENHPHKMYLMLDIPNPSQGWKNCVTSIKDENILKVDLFAWQMYQRPNASSTVQNELNNLGKSGATLDYMKKHSIVTASGNGITTINQCKEWRKSKFDVAGFGVYYLELDAFTIRQEWYTNTKRAIRILNGR